MEQPITFRCEGHELIGVLHGADLEAQTGVLIVVGGPQYRVGSHRQFVRQARDLAGCGYPVLRFDFRGMGDSTGPSASFTECAPDIRAAMAAFRAALPTVREFVVYGLCDGASAAAMYGARIAGVRGLVLINPWVSRDEQSSDAKLRFYYGRRLLDPAFWKKLSRGRVAVFGSMRDLVHLFRSKRQGTSDSVSYRQRMLHELEAFEGQTLIVLSGNDIVSADFESLIASDPNWGRVLAGEAVTVVRMAEANHTFSRYEWEQQLYERIRLWLQAS